MESNPLALNAQHHLSQNTIPPALPAPPDPPPEPPDPPPPPPKDNISAPLTAIAVSIAAAASVVAVAFTIGVVLIVRKRPRNASDAYIKIVKDNRDGVWSTDASSTRANADSVTSSGASMPLLKFKF
jgi:hypothetical protein